MQGLVEGGALERPAWLHIAVHVANSVVAWLDLLIGGLGPAGGRQLMVVCVSPFGLSCAYPSRRSRAAMAQVGVVDLVGCLLGVLGCGGGYCCVEWQLCCSAADLPACLLWPPRNCSAAVEERSFHGSSRHLALLFAVAYCTWLLVVRRNFGKVRRDGRPREASLWLQAAAPAAGAPSCLP